jgi:hypothetical protein
MGRNFLASQATISVSRRTMLDGVSVLTQHFIFEAGCELESVYSG